MRFMIHSATAVLAVFGLALVAGAQEDVDLFTRIDKNKDGKVNAAEVGSEGERLFNRLLRTGDRNQDGELTREEFTAAQKEEPKVQPRPAAQPGQPGGQFPAFEPEAMFKRLDQNGDGKVSKSEIPEDRAPFLKRALAEFDKNNDEALSLDEFRMALPMMRQGAGGPPGGPSKLIAALDANKDGKIDSDEIGKASDALRALDKNNDGTLTPDEVGPSGPPPGFAMNPEVAARIEAYMKKSIEADSNGDGKLSKEEAPEKLREVFERIDTNSDGQLDRAEIGAGLRRLLGAGRPEGAPPKKKD